MLWETAGLTSLGDERSVIFEEASLEESTRIR